MKQYVMALDSGTTSARTIIFDKSGRVCGMASREFTQHYPAPGLVEHAPFEILAAQLVSLHGALDAAGAEIGEIAAIGITNQRETTIVWDRETGEPVYNAIVWQCRRTSAMCDRLRAEGLEDKFRSRTGLRLDAYFSGTKLAWILENVPGARERAERGELLFGTVDSWLIWNLTGGRVHATDASNASRTLMFNINTLDWDDELLSILGIPRSMLPRVCPSSGFFGDCDAAVLGAPVPIYGVAGDQQAALFGQTCFERGETKNTYGTGCFMLMNIGEKPVFSENGLLTTVAWKIGDKTEYALEGSVFVAGAVVQWLRDELGLIKSASETEWLARSVPDSAGCYVVPAFTGLGTPHWDQYARGCIVGLTRGVKREHIVRAALESMAYQTNDVLRAMEADSGIKLLGLQADGGASANDFLMQFQSDITGVPLSRPKCVETTALGAAYLAGLACGFWESAEELVGNSRARVFTPSMDGGVREKLLAGWKKAVSRSLDWESR